MTYPNPQRHFINNRCGLNPITGRSVSMSPQTRLYITLMLILAAVLALTGCGGQPASPTAAPLTETSIQFSWLANNEFAGLYMAQSEGYYTAENLKVEFMPGGFDDQGNYINPIEQVATGNADFGIADGADLLDARAQGQPIVAIASIFQRHPEAYVSLAEKNIVRPEDLIGKKVLVAAKARILLNALLAAQNIDPSQVDIIDRTDFSFQPLLTGDVDVIDAFITDAVVRLKAEGHAVNSILLIDYGIESYPNAIFTTEDMVKNKPDVVERFLRATLKGIQSAVDNSEEAAKQVLVYNQDLTLESQIQGLQAALPLFKPAGTNPGMMTAQTWEFTANMLLEQGILQQIPELSQVYTLEFLNKIYGS